MPSRSPAKMSKLTLDFPRHLQEVAIEEAMRIKGAPVSVNWQSILSSIAPAGL